MLFSFFFFLMIRRPPRSTLDRSSAASDVYKRQALSRYLKKIKPQVVIAGQTHVQIMTLLARKKSLSHIPVILNEHSTFSTNNPGKTIKSRLIRILAKYYFRRADAIIAVSEGVKQDMFCLLYTSPSPRDRTRYRMPSSA